MAHAMDAAGAALTDGENLAIMTAKFEASEISNKTLSGMYKNAQNTIAVCTGSVQTAQITAYQQVRGGLTKPGENLDKGQTKFLKELLGIETTARMQKLERVFKLNNPRYDKQSTKFAHGGRKSPKVDARKCVLDALAQSTLVVPAQTATNISNLTKAVTEVYRDGLKAGNSKYTNGEAAKYWVASHIKSQSGNKKVASRAFVARSKTKPMKDSP